MPIFHKCDVIRIHWIIYDDNDLVYYDNRPVNERFTHGQPHSKVNVFHKPIIRGKDYGSVAFGKSPHSPDEIIKNKVYVIVFFLCMNSLLSFNKCKSFPQFHHELFKICNNILF